VELLVILLCTLHAAVFVVSRCAVHCSVACVSENLYFLIQFFHNVHKYSGGGKHEIVLFEVARNINLRPIHSYVK